MQLTKTITTIFMVPSLKIDREKLAENGFINAYSKDSKREDHLKNSIYLVFHPKNVDKFKLFLDSEYERTKAIVEDYDYPNGYVVLVYTLDNKFKNDFDKIREGKYSKTSKDFQDLFPKILKVKKNGISKDEISLQFRVFNKSEDLKLYWEENIGIMFDDDMEVWQGWIEEREILNIENLK